MAAKLTQGEVEEEVVSATQSCILEVHGIEQPIAQPLGAMERPDVSLQGGTQLGRQFALVRRSAQLQHPLPERLEKRPPSLVCGGPILGWTLRQSDTEDLVGRAAPLPIEQKPLFMEFVGKDEEQAGADGDALSVEGPFQKVLQLLLSEVLLKRAPLREKPVTVRPLDYCLRRFPGDDRDTKAHSSETECSS
jgi:hypothetical protein